MQRQLEQCRSSSQHLDKSEVGSFEATDPVGTSLGQGQEDAIMEKVHGTIAALEAAAKAVLDSHRPKVEEDEGRGATLG